MLIKGKTMGKSFRQCLAATAVILSVSAPAQAWNFGCPSCCWVEQVVTCFRNECRTEYRDVQYTVQRCVPETSMREIKETVLMPRVREVQRQRTILVPVHREETRERTVVRCEWVTEKRERTIMVPVTR